MRNINKIKELKDDKYQFSLDNLQVASIIISSIFLGGVLFFTGYFIGKEGDNKKIINNEANTKNIAIINTTKEKIKEIPKKELAPKIKTKKEVKINDDDLKKSDKLKTNIPENKELIAKKDTIEEKKDTNTDKTVKIEVPKLDSKKIGKGTGDNPFKTDLKSSKEGKYVLQILATPKHQEAATLRDKLIDSGYNAFIEKVDSKGVEYNRVRIGFFETFEKTGVFKSKFEKESGIKKTFITIKK